MISAQINQTPIEVPEGTTLLQAARQLDIDIPTLCYLEGLPHFTSCMLCLVKDVESDKLVASCSMPVAEGMVVETDSEEVHAARKTALELLMSDHVGDCIAPCERTCPAHMNIPLMNKHIEAGRDREALVTVKQHIALPAVLGRICAAPCENNCYRSRIDGAVSICALKCYVADQDLASGSPYLPARKTPSGKRVAIIGSGPTGLSAAYYLQLDGHACTIFDDHPEPGGMLRYGVAETDLPRDILDLEIDVIRKLGARFDMQQQIGLQLSLAELRETFDAVVLATGQVPPEELKKFEVDSTTKSVRVDNATFATSTEGIFAGGGVVNPGKMAVRSVGHGRSIAISVDRYLWNQVLPVINNRSQSRVGKLREGELLPVIEAMHDLKRLTYEREFERTGLDHSVVGIAGAQAIGESGQCLQCGCASFHGCDLRIYSEQYGANAQRFKGERRKSVERILDHPFVVYEPGKCIQCGLCVRITEAKGEDLGLVFVGRGFNVRVEAPLNGTMDGALQKTARECIAACPSGALLSRDMLCEKMLDSG